MLSRIKSLLQRILSGKPKEPNKGKDSPKEKTIPNYHSPKLTPSSYDSGFKFGKESLRNRSQAHPDLQAVLDYAIRISKVDFKIGEVARSFPRQVALKAQGKSHTLRSRHLVNPKDGKAYACDVYAIVNGKVSWDWVYYYQICDAFIKACKALDVHIVWGGNWNIDLNVTNLDAKEIHKLYRGKLHDGVHFELSRLHYGEY